ncbi:cypemycin family RiPP [Acaricomes phytoseiuli]|uniref:cypemycin family RiPP n=1 Tax=Acaricomes phytoseiuli TaxID=291968 RepID=UPI0012EA6BA2
MYAVGSSNFSSLQGAVNFAFSDVHPGYMGSNDSPVMTTPTTALIAPAAAMAVTGSTLCLAC